MIDGDERAREEPAEGSARTEAVTETTAVPEEGAPVEEGESAEEAEHVEISSELEELRREVEYLNDRHLRLAAEFDNYRRRSQAQLGESGARAQAQLVGQVVDVLDDLERVMAVDPELASVESVLEGVALVRRKLLQLLQEAGLEELDPAGEPFDPNLMEALARLPAESPEEDDRVEEVLQRGFRFRGHLVRPARVSVRKYD